MRQEYGVARAASIELAYSICQNLRAVPLVRARSLPPSALLRFWPPFREQRALPADSRPLVCLQRNADGDLVQLTPADREKIMKQNEHARKTLIRYLNFAHLLLLIEAQKSEKADFTDSPDKRLVSGEE